MRYAFVFGRTPELSRAELEHLGEVFSMKYQVLAEGSRFLVVDSAGDPTPLFDRLGGTVKVIDLGAKLSDLRLPEGKISFGVSLYGGGDQKGRRGLEIQIKESLRQKGRNSRFVRSDDLEISSGTVTRERLLEKGFEWNVIKVGEQTFEGPTVWIQPIEGWAARDQERPRRDARVGMLPPKLARILVNLAVTHRPEEAPGPVYDPFCGTGTILQESLVSGYDAAGADTDPKMVVYTTENLEWLRERLRGLQVPSEIALRQASEAPPYECEAIATEGYLGPPREELPTQGEFSRLESELKALYGEALKAMRPVLRPGRRAVICLPFFRKDERELRVSFVDALVSGGYNLVGSYDYRRENQIVGRQILILERK